MPAAPTSLLALFSFVYKVWVCLCSTSKGTEVTEAEPCTTSCLISLCLIASGASPPPKKKVQVALELEPGTLKLEASRQGKVQLCENLVVKIRPLCPASIYFFT